MAMKIIVGVDGSVPSARAVAWCAQYASVLSAEVVAVYSYDIPVYPVTAFGAGPIAMPIPPEPDRDELERVVRDEWCAALTKAGIAFRVVVKEGSPAAAIMSVAEAEAADLVVTGRRGRGGFAELLLGSTSHHLSHHLDRPLVIVP